MSGNGELLADVLDISRNERTPERLEVLSLAVDLAELCRLHAGQSAAEIVLMEVLHLADPSLTRAILPRVIVSSVVRSGGAPTRPNGPPTSPRLVPALVQLATLLRALPTDALHASEPWLFVASRADQLGIADHVLLGVQGWLRGDASQVSSEEVTRLLEDAQDASSSSRALADGARDERTRALLGLQQAGVASFSAFQSRVREALSVADARAEAFGVSRFAIGQLIERIDEDYFRIAILGEFKRGKSSFVNAMLGTPSLVAVATLPCTSAVIEVRYAEEEAFMVAEGGGRAFVVSDRNAFERETSRAAESEAVLVSRWRVNSRSPFLKDSFVELVDTPGIGEDPVRDKIARDEALRADAAIILFDVAQIGTMAELELVNRFAGRLENVMLVLNKADTVPQQEWTRVQDHLLGRLFRQNTPIPRDRVAFICSSISAQSASGNGQVAAEAWAERLEDLRQRIKRHLFATTGPRKMLAIANDARRIADSYENNLEHALARRRRKLKELNDVLIAQESARRDYESARVGVIAASAAVQASCDETVAAIQRAFWEAWPNLLKQIELEKDTWVTKYHPVGSPSLHAQAVAECAKVSVLTVVEAWFVGEGASVLAAQFEKVKVKCVAEFGGVGDLLGVRSDELFDQLVSKALRESVGGTNAGAADSALASVAGTAVAVIVGYVIADIVLFYMIGAIAGFLNPVLLAAAVAGGVAIWLVKGEDYVRGMIRSMIFKKLVGALKEPANRAKLNGGMADKIRLQLSSLGDALRESSRHVVEEAYHQSQRTASVLEERLREHGDTETLGKLIQEMERDAEAVRGALCELRDLANEVSAPRCDLLAGS